MARLVRYSLHRMAHSSCRARHRASRHSFASASRVARRGLALVACLAGLACAGEDESKPPNLLLITIDSLRADFLSCYGGEPRVGERVCALGERGARYVWAFAPASSSAASIASILTSTYPSTHGVGYDAASFLRAAAETFPEELRRAGYRTGAFVGSPELNRSRNFQQGFDHYDDRVDHHRSSQQAERVAEDTTSALIAWLATVEEPWFAWIHYRDPHGPYAAPGPGGGAGGDAGTPPVPEVGERLRVLPTATGRGGIPSYQALPGLFTREAYEARYRDEIRYVDGQIARLLALVDAPGGSDDPIARATGVLVTADHGEAFGEDRYYFTHGHSVGLDQIRVPLLWRPPGGSAPEEIRGAVSTLDVGPTLLRAAGLGAPDSYEGFPLLREGTPPGAPELARAIFAEHPSRVAVLSGGNYYARDREPVGAGDLTRLTEAKLRHARARTASLTAAGEAGTQQQEALPGYRAARPAAAASFLEPRLAEFLAAARTRSRAAAERPASDE